MKLFWILTIGSLVTFSCTKSSRKSSDGEEGSVVVAPQAGGEGNPDGTVGDAGNYSTKATISDFNGQATPEELTVLLTNSDLSCSSGEILVYDGSKWVCQSPETVQDITVTSSLTFSGGSPGDSKLLTSDSAGTATWRAWGPILPVTPPVFSEFTWVNQGAATHTAQNGVITITAPASGSFDVKMLVQSLSAAPYTVTIGFESLGFPALAHSSGIVLRNSSDGKLITFGLSHQGTSVLIDSDYFTNETSHVTQNYSIDLVEYPATRFFRIEDNTTNLIYSVSNDGEFFMPIQTLVSGAHTTPDQAGIFTLNTNSNPSSIRVFHFEIE